MAGLVTVGVLVVLVGAAAAALVLASRRVPGPDEALVVTGYRPDVVIGRGVWVRPGLDRTARVSLRSCVASFRIGATTAQGIDIGCPVELGWRVPPEPEAIRRAVSRFGEALALPAGSGPGGPADVGGSPAMRRVVAGMVAAQVRAHVAEGSPERLLASRNEVVRAIRAGVSADLEPMGLRLEWLEAGPWEDPTGYLADLARIPAAEVSRRARAAVAEADAAAVASEQDAAQRRERARRDADLARAGFDSEVDRATALARHAGPIAAAEARRALLEEETRPEC